MTNIFKYKITEKTSEIIEYHYEVDLETLSGDRFNKIIQEMKYGVIDGYKTLKLEVDVTDEFVWTEGGYKSNMLYFG